MNREGKLSLKEIQDSVLKEIKKTRKEVTVGAGLGIDCAIIKSNGYISVTVDPITAAENDIGLLSVLISSNDTYSAGAEPVAMTVTLLMPINSSTKAINSIMKDIVREATKQNIEVIGGHTEFTSSVTRPITCVSMLGKINKSKPNKIKNGDSIIVTKSLGIEGTVILSNRIRLTDKDKKELSTLKNQLSIREEALIANKYNAAMHDITEGGIVEALSEALVASNLGCEVNLTGVIINPLTRKICDKLNLDVFRLISSGSLLIFTNKEKEIIKGLKKKHIDATVIGKVNKSHSIKMIEK